MRMAVVSLVLLLGVAGGLEGRADPASTAPASAPTTRYIRHVAQMPPGFHALSDDRHTAWCRPEDDAWVRQALAAAPPTSRPTTLATDVLRRIQDNRQIVIGQMVADLAMPDAKAANAFFDDDLIPAIQKLRDLKPTVYFLATDRKALREAMKAGWSDPRYHFNRFSHDVQFDSSMGLTLERDLDDFVEPDEYHDDDPPETRRDQLAKIIGLMDGDLTDSMRALAPIAVHNLVVHFLTQSTITPLKLKEEQRWIGAGIVGVLAAKYGAELTGYDRDYLIAPDSQDNPINPTRPAWVDLLNPIPIDDMQPDYLLRYRDAYIRKSVRVVNYWLATTAASDGVVPRTVVALRKQLPPDNAALVKLLNQIGGIDLTTAMQPNSDLTIKPAVKH